MVRRILLVDDDIAAIATIRRVLSREGLQVLLATSAADATIALDHHEPEVVLLAPGVDGKRGAGVRRHLRESRRGAEILVLLLGEGDDPVFEGDPTFEKPVDPLAVLAALRTGKVETPQAVAAPGWMEEPGDSEPPPEDPPLSPEELTVPRGDADAPDLFPGPTPWDAPPPAATEAATDATAPPTPRAESLRREERARAAPDDLDFTRVEVGADEEDDIAARIDRAIAEVDRGSHDAPGESGAAASALEGGAQARPAQGRPGANATAGKRAATGPAAAEKAAAERAAAEKAAAERAAAEKAAAEKAVAEKAAAEKAAAEKAAAEKAAAEKAAAEKAAAEKAAAEKAVAEKAAAERTAAERAAAERTAAERAAAEKAAAERTAAERAAAEKAAAEKAAAEKAAAEKAAAEEAAAEKAAAGQKAAAEHARAEAEREAQAARAEAEAARAAEREQARDARAAAERAARELAHLRAQAQEQVREAAAAARNQASAELSRLRQEAAAREEQLRQDLEASHRAQLERALGEARALAVEAMAQHDEATRARHEEAVERARKEAAEKAREAFDVRLREALEQTRTAMQEKARRAVTEVQAQGERHMREAVAVARRQLEEEFEARIATVREELGAQVQEARRSLEKLRAGAEAALRRQQSEHAEALARLTAERDALVAEREMSRSAAELLHERGEELRRHIAQLETALEEERRQRAAEAEAAAGVLRRAEADADRRLREATARAEEAALQRAEEELRREAQAEALARADARRQAALESRRTPVPGLPAPSALLQHLRSPALVDIAELPLPTSEPVPDEEPIPEATPDEPLPAEGIFVDAGRLLARLSRTTATGRLELSIAGGRRTIWFERGRVSGAESDVAAERLEEIAHREGLISREQRAWARTAPAAGARQLAAMLSERGHLKAAELVPLVRRRVTEIVVAAFEHDGGRFTFAPEPVDPDERVLLPESTLAVITEGIRRKQLAPRLFARLGGPGTLLRPLGGGPALEELGLTARERRVVWLADGLRTLDEILLDAGTEETLALGALWSAVVAGVLEIAVRGVPAAAEDGSLDRSRLEEKSRQVREADYFEVLGVSRSCTAYEVDAAFERLAHEFAPARHAALGDPAALRALQEIQGVLSDAREVLRDDRLRREYARNLGPTGT